MKLVAETPCQNCGGRDYIEGPALEGGAVYMFKLGNGHLPNCTAEGSTKAIMEKITEGLKELLG